MNPTQGPAQVATSSTAPSNPDVNPTISTLLKGVQSEYAKGPQTFNQSLYAGLGNTTQQGLSNTLAASNNADYTRGINGGMAMTADVASGKYLNGGNPYFEANLSKALNDTASGINAGLGSSGRLGSNLQVQSLAEGLGNLSNSARGAQYETERDRQMQAQAALPGLYQAGLAPAATQLQVGSLQDADRQATLQGEYDLQQRQANGNTDLLAKLSSILAGNAAAGGATTTSTTPGAMQPSIFQQLLGAGAVGSGIYKNIWGQ